MDLASLPWKTVCCSDHQSATVNDGESALSVQRNKDTYAVLVVRSGVIESRLTGISKDEAESAISDF